MTDRNNTNTCREVCIAKLYSISEFSSVKKTNVLVTLRDVLDKYAPSSQ